MLRTNVCGVEFRNPLMLAAGVMGSNASSMNWILKSGAAGVVSKSFSLEPNPGYANPTTVGVECGIINAIGLSNPGAENFKEELKRIDRKGNVSIASIYGATPEEFSKLVLEIEDYVDMIELNISCPHAMEGYGASIGQDANLTHKIVSAAKDSANKAIKPIALRNVYTVYDNVDIPIIGVGGISNFEDVVEFLFAGARAVQIGTSIMDEGVEVFGKINKDLEEFMNKKGYESIDEMIGLAHEEL